MKITSIDVKNYLGISSLDATISAKVFLVAGQNGAGKSSLAEAIRHALLGSFSRVAFKKDLHSLLHDGADAGHAIIETDVGEYSAILPVGDVTGDHSALNGALEYCLKPGKFSGMDESDRRKFLFKLMGVKITGNEIEGRLIKHGANSLKVNEIVPYLSGGFGDAAAKAAEHARDNKTAWRVLTGENYGEKKAEGWKKPIPEAPATIVDQEQIAAADKEIETISGVIGEYRAKMASANMSKDTIAQHNKKIEALREHASKYARIADKLNLDEKELEAWGAKISALIASGVSQGDPLECPHCGGISALSTHEHRLELVSDQVMDPEYDRKILEYKAAEELMRSAVENGKRDLAAADNAAVHLRALEDQGVSEAPDVGALQTQIASYEATLQQKKDHRDAIRHSYQQTQASLKAAEDATVINNRAANYHKDVMEWDFIAKLLEPDGIQAEMLAEAIEPFNLKLFDLSNAVYWPPVQIDSDMSIFVGEHRYELRSESEQWRADAIIAAAIAIISGVRMIMLDRFDVLDLPGRAQLFTWLSTVDLDQVVTLGTMKAKPAGMPAYINPIWLGK